MKTAVFGELLFDIIDGTPRIGGAPFNFAAHMTKLGFDAHLITCVGDDPLGRDALAKIRSLDMHEDFISQTSALPTGTVQVTAAAGDAQYEFSADAAWDTISVEDSPALAYEMWDLFYFGSLAQRSEHNRSVLKGLLDETLSARHLFFDANLRQGLFTKEILEYSLLKATILKTNREEALTLLNMFSLDTAGSAVEHARAISAAFNLETVIITDGGNEVTILNGITPITVQVPKASVADTVGCGDAFSAGFCFGLLQGLPFSEAGRLGSLLGSYVASRPGAVPEYSPEVISAFLSLGQDDIVE
ncbi:MAG: carbohydrate kinase [Spirochaetales bacterium]|nr:carbohydrate kinase [Spirochaetales bacterium]